MPHGNTGFPSSTRDVTPWDVRRSRHLQLFRRLPRFAEHRAGKPHRRGVLWWAEKVEDDDESGRCTVGEEADCPFVQANAEHIRLVEVENALGGLFDEGVAFYLEVEDSRVSSCEAHARDIG